MLGSSSYEFNTTMECRDRGSDDDHSIMGGGGYNNINLLRNGRGGEFQNLHEISQTIEKKINGHQ